MKNYIPDMTEEQQIKMALANQCVQSGIRPLNDPFRATNGYITNKYHLKQQSYKG